MIDDYLDRKLAPPSSILPRHSLTMTSRHSWCASSKLISCSINCAAFWLRRATPIVYLIASWSNLPSYSCCTWVAELFVLIVMLLRSWPESNWSSLDEVLQLIFFYWKKSSMPCKIISKLLLCSFGASARSSAMKLNIAGSLK